MKTMIIPVLLCLLLCKEGAAQTINRYDIVIDELMADPTPQVALPNNEWIELRNVSPGAINLLGWKIGDATSQSGAMPAYILKPDSLVIICSAGSLAAMQAYGPAISVTGFPSLDNGGDQVFLRSAQNKIIHSVTYTDQWYGNELKKDGGWTLEMTDTKNPCQGSANWKAATDVKGGTPGRKNSTDGSNPDKTGPRLLRAYATDSISITLVFDEPLDSLRASVNTNFNISDGIGTPQNVQVTAPAFDRVILKTAIPLQKNKLYMVTAVSLADCAGNLIESKKAVKAGLASNADSFDVVINEILFNPRDNGADYVELYNRSKKIIDLKNMYIANRNSAGQISSITRLSAENYLLFPEEFIVVTSDIPVVKRDFIALAPEAFTEVSSMPSYNDDKGDAIVLNEQGKIIDELAYSDKWHFKLIDTPEGVSLERIEYNAATQDAENWHSASTSAGYGTPTYKNSQYHTGGTPEGMVTLSPEIVSPDNDGVDDFASIGYSFPSPGYVANIIIFDAGGRVVRYLQRNALCGTRGNYRWDGLGEKNQRLPTGIYIFFTEVFNLEGKKKQFKNVIVLARRNN